MGAGIKSGISVGSTLVELFRSVRVGGTDPDGVTKVIVLNDGASRCFVWCKGHAGEAAAPVTEADMFPLDEARSIPFEIEVIQSGGTQIDRIYAKCATGVSTTVALCVIRHR